MRIVAISDTHGFEPKLPEGDILIHAGDALYRGTKSEWDEFHDWFAAQPHDFKIFVPGNHDKWVEHGLQGRDFLDFDVLIDEELEITTSEDNSIKIYGTPWIPPINGNWAWEAIDSFRTAKYNEIPNDLDILITHASPQGLGFKWPDMPLTYALHNKKPKLHICGHIHECGGERVAWSFPGTSYNVAVLDKNYKPRSAKNRVRVIDL